jgi:hypothetical protein
VNRPLVAAAFVLGLVLAGEPAVADSFPEAPSGSGETTPSGVRVTIIKEGNEYRLKDPPSKGGGGGAPPGDPTCVERVQVFTMPADPATGAPERRYALVSCGDIVTGSYWLADGDVVDLDAAAAAEAARYVEDVLTPGIGIGVNPAAEGLVGLPSWFWIDGWSGAAQAPPISAFGVTIDVRMSSGEVTWDFGDDTRVRGDLGRAYPEESTVRHAYQGPGPYTVTAAIALTPDYRVNGGPWITLPPLTAEATTQHRVQERQAVLTQR